MTTYFNEDFVNKLKKNGEELTNSSTRLWLLGKFLLKTEEYDIMYYPYAILPNDYLHVQSITVNYIENKDTETNILFKRKILEIKEVRNEISLLEHILKTQKNAIVIFKDFDTMLAKSMEFNSEIDSYTYSEINK